jgi:nucleoside phosphorylase
MDRERFDIAVVIPLEDEIIPFFEVFPSLEDRSDDEFLHHVIDSGHPDVAMVVVQQQKMGRTAAEEAAEMVLDRYDISLLACVGIAGSLSGDMRLGDVCHSSTLIDVLDNAKFSDAENYDENADIELSPTHYWTLRPILTRMNYIRTQPTLKIAYETWQAERALVAQKMVANEIPTPSGGMFHLGEPRSKSGPIVCGAISKSKVYNNKLRAIERSVLAIESETGGVFSRSRKTGVPVVTVRGISDYADKDKKKLEETSKGAVRHLAAGNAASFLRLQISANDYFRKGLAQLAAGQQTELALATNKTVSDPISAALDDLSAAIDENLRKLSPDYKLQSKGYRLPLPRVRPNVTIDGLDMIEGQLPIDVREVVETYNRVIINLPRTYPDQSLAWVIADDLCRADIGGRQPLPFVVNGDAIRGRNTTLAELCGPRLAIMAATSSVMPVVIIENIPFVSKHRREALVTEVALYPTVKFVFLTRGEADLASETEFSSKTASVLYDTCSISFMEISFFIQKNFEMSGTEAEVVALRLRDTFNRFNLDAHPTYFAGIPRETLAALLQANRRSELIQLAVDGFLTFVVAGDKADISLSRTTRARFLRQLVIDMHVEKRSYNQAQLVQRVRDFAEQHDFDINPISFIQGFIDHGIMHFEGETTKISLPFIESYLLADELSRNPNRAAAYFNMADDAFDLATFDLYAEIGPSAAVVEKVIEALQTSIGAVTLKADTDHILLGESISP